MDKSTFTTNWPANTEPVGDHLLVVDVADAVQDHFEDQSRIKLNGLITRLAATTTPSNELTEERDKALGHKKIKASGTTFTILTRNPKRRKHGVNRIHKIILHHHGGSTKLSGPGHESVHGFPKFIAGGASFFAKPKKSQRGYAYHYDVPYFPEKVKLVDVKGKVLEERIVVYNAVDPELVTNATNDHNRLSISVSMVGCMRSGGYPLGMTEKTARNPDQPSSVDYGRPHSDQVLAVKELLKYLQKKFDIANGHISGHFQHKKTACPGFDMEVFLLQHQDASRLFCYPIDLRTDDEPGSIPSIISTPTIPVVPTPPLMSSNLDDDLDKLLADAKKYLKNAREGERGGHYPFGRNKIWHNGTHLFPLEPKKRTPVFCVRDGWVLAAQLQGDVEVEVPIKGGGTETRQAGSPCFVLVQHHEYGVSNKKDKGRSMVNDRVRNLDYFSLYMHLDSIDTPGRIPWLKRLKERDEQRMDQILVSDTPTGFETFAVPIRAGEILGFVGEHNPFVMHPDPPSNLEDKSPFLHFEMFSFNNLVKLFDPDKDIHNGWTVVDKDSNAFTKDASLIKANKMVDALSKQGTTVRKIIQDITTKDPSQEQPNLAPQQDAQIDNVLSCLITQHVSEWGATWSGPHPWMNLLKKVTIKQKRKFLTYLEKVQWLRGATKIRKEFDTNPDHGQLNKSTKVFFYHPIRFLNWLNGMQRTLDEPAMASMMDKTPFPLKDAKLVKASEDSDTSITIGPPKGFTLPGTKRIHYSTALPKRLLEGATIIFTSGKNKSKKEGYTVKQVHDKVEKATLGRKVTLTETLEHEARKDDIVTIRQFDKGYNWHWESKFVWDTDLT